MDAGNRAGVYIGGTRSWRMRKTEKCEIKCTVTERQNITTKISNKTFLNETGKRGIYQKL
jgi:hypothetical protein